MRTVCRAVGEPRLPRHELLPFGLFSAATEDFPALADAGFTMVGPWYDHDDLRPRLDAAEAANLGAIVAVGYDHHRYVESRTIDWTNAEIRKNVTAQVEAHADHPAVRAWYLFPEELRYWSERELEYLRIAAGATRSADPMSRPVLSYQPNNRTAEHLRAIVAELDVVSKGTYANYTGHENKRGWVRWSVGESVVASRSVKHHPDVWAMPEMFTEPGERSHVSAWARHDVYASLAAGARGVLVFSGFRRQGFPSYDRYLEGYAAVATELNGETRLGAALLGPDCAGPRATMKTKVAPLVFDGNVRQRSLPAVTSRATVLDGRWYLLTVNSSEQTVEVRLDGTGDDARAVVGPEPRHEGTTLVLPPLGVSVLRGPNDPGAHSTDAQRAPAR